MCFIEFIGYACGHCSLPVSRPCPMTTSQYDFPVCALKAMRPLLCAEMCPPCSRCLHGRAVLIQEYEHWFLHTRGACGCPVIFPGFIAPRVVGGRPVVLGDDSGFVHTGSSSDDDEDPPRGPQPAPPPFREVYDRDGNVGYAVRVSSYYAPEWVEDHRTLHQSGRCTCSTDFNPYVPEWVTRGTENGQGGQLSVPATAQGSADDGDVSFRIDHAGANPSGIGQIDEGDYENDEAVDAGSQSEWHTPISFEQNPNARARRSASLDVPRAIAALAPCGGSSELESSHHDLPAADAPRSQSTTNLVSLPAQPSGKKKGKGKAKTRQNGQEPSQLAHEPRPAARHVTFDDNVSYAAAASSGVGSHIGRGSDIPSPPAEADLEEERVRRRIQEPFANNNNSHAVPPAASHVMPPHWHPYGPVLPVLYPHMEGTNNHGEGPSAQTSYPNPIGRDGHGAATQGAFHSRHQPQAQSSTSTQQYPTAQAPSSAPIVPTTTNLPAGSYAAEVQTLSTPLPLRYPEGFIDCYPSTPASVPTQALPIIGLPIGAGPEGISHVGPFEECVLHRYPPGARTRHYQ